MSLLPAYRSCSSPRRPARSKVCNAALTSIQVGEALFPLATTIDPSRLLVDTCRRIFHAAWHCARSVRLPSNTLRESGHPGSAGSCHSTKSLRDRGEVRLAASINPRRRLWVAGEAPCLEGSRQPRRSPRCVCNDRASFHFLSVRMAERNTRSSAWRLHPRQMIARSHAVAMHRYRVAKARPCSNNFLVSPKRFRRSTK